MGDTAVLRAHEGGIAALANGDLARLRQVIRRFELFERRNPVKPEQRWEAFVWWCTHLSGLAITVSRHKQQMARLRADLAGLGMWLAVVGDKRRGARRLDFTVGCGRDVAGSGFIAAGLLPRGVRSGDVLLVTISRPRCQRCGCTNERACPGGCSWVAPTLCSTCWPYVSRRRKARRV
jgi:hypothetical protein